MSRSCFTLNARSDAGCKTDLSMAEALNDPLIRTLMDADGVDAKELEHEFLRIAEARTEYQMS